MRFALVVLAASLSAAASAQVRTSDAPLVLALSAGTTYVVDVGRAGPSIGAELATRYVGFGAAMAFPNDDFERSVGLSAVVYPGGRTAFVAVSVGAELDFIHAADGYGGGPYTLAGPVGSVSFRAVDTPDVVLVPGISAGILLPIGTNASRSNLSAVSAVAASVTLGGRLSPGVVTAVTPSVSRSSPLGGSSDDATVALGVRASMVVDL